MDEVGGDESAPPVEQFAVVKAVLVHGAPDEDVVAADQRNFGFRIVVGRLAEWVVCEPKRSQKRKRKTDESGPIGDRWQTNR